MQERTGNKWRTRRGGAQEHLGIYKVKECFQGKSQEKGPEPDDHVEVEEARELASSFLHRWTYKNKQWLQVSMERFNQAFPLQAAWCSCDPCILGSHSLRPAAGIHLPSCSHRPTSQPQVCGYANAMLGA